MAGPTPATSEFSRIRMHRDTQSDWGRPNRELASRVERPSGRWEVEIRDSEAELGCNNS